MKRGFVCLIALLSLSCISSETAELDDPLLVRCTEPRPQICTREYVPVCGVRSDGSTSTYGNGCGACGDERVIGHRPGECPPEE